MTEEQRPIGCVFDAYGTLFNVAAATQRCRDALGPSADAFAALWRSKQLEYSWLRSLRGDYIDFWRVTGQSLDFALASFGIDDPALRSRLMELYFVLATYPEVSGVVQTLRAAGLKTAILSNGSPNMLTAAVQSGGLIGLFDAIISADAAGIFKPSPKVYDLAVERLRAPAERLWFVSSNYWDVSGAAAFGFRVVWVNRAGARRDPLPGVPEHEIASLEALPALIEDAGGAREPANPVD
ncbi:MAG: haloacid dehalogenase type II [Rhodospirillales bacterium]|nr:haloacid dehalogenase type II [Rhodospirillales bacterium]